MNLIIEALRCYKRCQRITVLLLLTRTTSAFAFPVEAATTNPRGMEPHLDGLLAHPSTNWTLRCVTLLIETNAVNHCTTPPPTSHCAFILLMCNLFRDMWTLISNCRQSRQRLHTSTGSAIMWASPLRLGFLSLVLFQYSQIGTETETDVQNSVR